MSKPTIPELDRHLKDLVNWKQFALHLPGTDNTDIRVIESNKRDDTIDLQKIALYEKWLQVNPEASWGHVITALETVRENSIAKQLKEKYLTAITHPPPTCIPAILPAQVSKMWSKQ